MEGMIENLEEEIKSLKESNKELKHERSDNIQKMAELKGSLTNAGISNEKEK